MAVLFSHPLGYTGHSTSRQVVISMKTQGCRNCGSAEIYFKEIPIGSTWCAVLLPIGPRLVGRASSMAAYEIRICGVCGLVDWFVPERLLPQVKEKFSRIPEV